MGGTRLPVRPANRVPSPSPPPPPPLPLAVCARSLLPRTVPAVALHAALRAPGVAGSARRPHAEHGGGSVRPAGPPVAQPDHRVPGGHRVHLPALPALAGAHPQVQGPDQWPLGRGGECAAAAWRAWLRTRRAGLGFFLGGGGGRDGGKGAAHVLGAPAQACVALPDWSSLPAVLNLGAGASDSHQPAAGGAVGAQGGGCGRGQAAALCMTAWQTRGQPSRALFCLWR